MSQQEGPPVFTNCLMVPTGMHKVFCAIKTQKGQQLLSELHTKGIHVLCGCEQPMGIVEHGKASKIIPWMEQGWVFICTVEHREGSKLYLKFEPIKGLGKSMTTEKKVTAPKATEKPKVVETV